MKRFNATGLFAFIVAVLVAFTAFDYWSSQKKESVKEQATKIVQLSKDEITSISITGSITDSKTPPTKLKLEKKGNHWSITSPIQESADQQVMFAYLDQLVGEKINQTVAEGTVNLRTYGLDQPLFTLVLSTSGGAKTQTLTLGSVRAFDGSLYGRIDDQAKVLLISSAWDVILTRPVGDFRDTKVFHREIKAPFDTIKVTSRDVKFEIKRENGKYILLGSADPAFQPSIEAWIEQVKAFRGAAFVENPKGVFEAEYTIEMKRGDEPPFILKVARDHLHPEQFEVTSSDLPGAFNSRVIAGKSALNSVMVEKDVLYSKTAPFEFDAKDVTQLKYHDEASGKDLDTPVDPKNPDPLIAKLRALTAVRFLGPEATYARKPQLTADAKEKFLSRLSLLKSDGSVVFEMSWGKPVTEHATLSKPEARFLPVKTNLTHQVVGVPEKLIADLGEGQPLVQPEAPSEDQSPAGGR